MGGLKRDVATQMMKKNGIKMLIMRDLGSDNPFSPLPYFKSASPVRGTNLKFTKSS